MTDSVPGGLEATVWIGPGATTFSCLCERCLEDRGGDSFLDAVRVSVVRGRIELDTDVAFAHCTSGHRLVVRRVERPPNLARRSARQLQIA